MAAPRTPFLVDPDRRVAVSRSEHRVVDDALTVLEASERMFVQRQL